MIEGVLNVPTNMEIPLMTSTLPPLLRFANFEVNLRAGERRRERSEVRLQEQPFLLLIVLLESAGEVVTREELRKRLWAADTFVDFDHRQSSPTVAASWSHRLAELWERRNITS